MAVRRGVAWTPQRLAWSAVLMAWSETTPLVERFAGVRQFLARSRPHWRIGCSYSGWSDALQREQSRLVPKVIQRLRAQMRLLADVQRCGRWEAYGVDGSDEPCSRTTANQAAMGDKGKPDGMPLAAMTMLVHLRTALPWSFCVGPGVESERAHLRRMADDLPAGSLLVADAGFVGYELCRYFIERKQHFLWRVGGNIRLLAELDGAHQVEGSTVFLWPNDFRNEPPLQLRLIKIESAEKQPVYLVTSVLEDETLTDAEAAEIYRRRWEIELNYRALKQTLQRSKLRSQTPTTCYLELTWAILGWWLLQLMNVQALTQVGVDPQRGSPAQTRDALRRCLKGDPPCRRTRRSLLEQLRQCRQDEYVRTRSKAARRYPRKKRRKPPRPPRIKPLNEKQLLRMKRLTPLFIPD